MKDDPSISRRRFGAIAGGALASFAWGEACHRETQAREAADGRLTARPRAAVGKTPAEGRRVLGLDPRRDAVLQIPAQPDDRPMPLFVLLHGAGGTGEGVLRRLGSAPDAAHVAVLAPDSRESTWDAIRGEFGPDVAFIDRALQRVFESASIDPERIAVGGFSDGATYALSLGLINGDLFHRIVAFSPGFLVDGAPHGKPAFFISHGTADPILPIDRCSRPIVSGLTGRGYDVTFREFDGGHEIPAGIARDGLRWVAGLPPIASSAGLAIPI